jgi:hypothetical protein
VSEPINQPDVVDEYGNISVHGREGLNLPISFQDADGNPRDVSLTPLFFEVKGKFRKALETGVTNDVRALVLTQAEVSGIGTTPVMFALIDESNVVGGDVIPDVLWEGKISYRGYTSAP